MLRLTLWRPSRVVRRGFCSSPEAVIVAPSSSSPSSPRQMRPSHIIYHLLKQKGPLTRNQIEEELSAQGFFDLKGHLARSRLAHNKKAIGETNRKSTPSKPVIVPRSRLQPLIPLLPHQRQQEEKKILSSKRVTEVPLDTFFVSTPEFKQLAKVNTELAFPSTLRINAALDDLRRKGKIETKPKSGQEAVRGRKIYAFRIVEGRAPIFTPEEYEASGRKERREALLATSKALRDARIQEKKEAWASYINGEERRISSLIDPRVLQAREDAKREKRAGLKA